MNDAVNYEYPWIDYNTATTIDTATASRISDIETALKGLSDKIRQLSSEVHFHQDSINVFTDVCKHWGTIKDDKDDTPLSEAVSVLNEPPTFGNEFIDDMIGGDHHD